MATDEGLVPVREAARLIGLPQWQVHRWVRRGLLTGEAGRYGWLVRPSAVHALAAAASPPSAPRPPVTVPAGTPEYVPPSIAARIAGIPVHRIRDWARRGKLTTQPGHYGHLVSLADVLAYVEVADSWGGRRAEE